MSKVVEAIERMGEYKLEGEVFGFAFMFLVESLIGCEEFRKNPEKYDNMIIQSIEDGCIEWDV
jgi:hypothetical protein